MRVAIADATDRWLGGVETYIDLLIPALLDRGHDVLFLHEPAGDAGRPPIPAIGRVPQLAIDSNTRQAATDRLVAWKPEVVFAQAFSDPANESAVLGVAPSVFFAHAYYGTCISGNKAWRLPVTQPCDRVFGPACLLLYFPRRCGGRDPRTMLAEYRRQQRRLEALEQYAAVVTFSEHMRQEYLAHGFSADHVTRLPPVYPSLADGTQARVTRRPTQASDTLRLGFVGRVEHLKGLHVLLESLPIVRAREPRPILVTVAGDGPELARCRVMAERIERETRGVRCNFVGWASQQRCVEIVDGSDVLVVPSLWPEPFGLTGAEAVQRGVPVAAFRVGAIPEWLIDGENGGLAPSDPPTAEGLASAILRARDVGQRHASAVIGTSELRSASAASWLTTHVDALLAVLGRAARGVRSSGRATTKAVSGGAA